MIDHENVWFSLISKLNFFALDCSIKLLKDEYIYFWSKIAVTRIWTNIPCSSNVYMFCEKTFEYSCFIYNFKKFLPANSINGKQFLFINQTNFHYMANSFITWLLYVSLSLMFACLHIPFVFSTNLDYYLYLNPF